MLLREDEARQKWCPFSRPMLPQSGDFGFQAGNRNYVPEGVSQVMPASSCLGSECMAWRWARTHIPDPDGGRDLIPSSDTYGYCGMAGDPFLLRRGGPDAA